MQNYHPPQEILERYASVLVNFALGSGNGVQPDEVVYATIPDVAKPMFGALQKAILAAGAHPMLRLIATGFDRQFYDMANQEQIEFFPNTYYKGLVDTIDHRIAILADHDLHELEGVPPKKMMDVAKSKQPLRQWFNQKEAAGEYTWTLALYGTPAVAKEADLTEEEYWDQIIAACFLDQEDPIQAWKKIFDQIESAKNTLNALPIEKLHVTSDDIDLHITLGEKRRWVGGSGRNIPSFELFTSPDWRGTEGTVHFNQPLYREGSIITDITLTFKDGVIVEASAAQNQDLLKEMVAQPNANKVGEFSLTDKRFSRITQFMANTLYDENVGGPFGNTHIAIGMSYQDAYDGDASQLTKEDFDTLGFNDIYCPVHTDIMSTTNRTVTAALSDGSEKVIYENGQFTFI